MLNTLIIEDDTTIQAALRHVIQHEHPDVRLCTTCPHAGRGCRCAAAPPPRRGDYRMLTGGEVFALFDDLRASTPDTKYTASSIAIVSMTAHGDKAIDSTRYPNCGVLPKPFEPPALSSWHFPKCCGLVGHFQHQFAAVQKIALH